MLAAVWLALSASFFAALLALQVPPLKTSRGAPSLNLAGIFQDLVRYGKTKAAGGQRPVLLQIFDVPKRWFYHFYIVSVTWNGFLLLLFMQCVLFSRAFPFWIRGLLDVLDEAKEDRSVHHLENGAEFLSAFLVCFLVWVNSCRRLQECLHISIYSGGVIHFVHYCFGLFYYVLVGLTVLCQVPAKSREGKDHSLMVCWYHVLGLVMFCWASVHQHRCHVILANLRKDKSGKVVSLDHSIPFGDWFEMVSCPHYFAEFLIYTSMAVTFGFYNLTWWLVVTYVFFNQALSAVLCHEYYLNKFKHYPKYRKAYVPFIF
ncbi:polyprenol reductase [Protobothrops mucrosquamatus]|uniref:polyprenol reductase n=1 Tax=Protobothrops mucrosquamatus TaxID=103944 RepID=UPI000775CE4F|nr:polyprenol reductase [Protobothrops mucrosquamatus]